MSTAASRRADVSEGGGHIGPYERAVVLDESAIASLVARRRATGMDRFDEVWDGVLHMVPPPSEAHSGAWDGLHGALFPVVQRRGGRLRIQLGVRRPGTADDDYRVPDLVYLAPEDLPKQGRIYCDGGPAVVFEILSPRDESYRKLDFYASIGTREVVIVDPIGRRAEVYRLAGAGYVPAVADDSGRVPVEALGVRFERREEGGETALFLRDDGTGSEQRIA